MQPTIFGIPNCDTMKKALDWLDRHQIECRFHNYRKDGVPRQLLEGWVKELGWEALLNRNGTTFRKLTDSDKTAINASKALDLMYAQPSLIRRPVLDTGKRRVVGFIPQVYATLF